jgi:hypothetical protein
MAALAKERKNKKRNVAAQIMVRRAETAVCRQSCISRVVKM